MGKVPGAVPTCRLPSRSPSLLRSPANPYWVKKSPFLVPSCPRCLSPLSVPAALLLSFGIIVAEHPSSWLHVPSERHAWPLPPHPPFSSGSLDLGGMNLPDCGGHQRKATEAHSPTLAFISHKTGAVTLVDSAQVESRGVSLPHFLW